MTPEQYQNQELHTASEKRRWCVQLGELYSGAKMEEIESQEIPASIAEEMEMRVHMHSISQEKDKPIWYFKITNTDGAVVYGSRYQDEYWKSVADKQTQTRVRQIESTEDSFVVFQFDQDGERTGYGNVHKSQVSGTQSDSIPLVGYVETEENGINKKLGGERYFLLNALSKTSYGEPLNSSTAIMKDGRAYGFWQKLNKLGGARVVETTGNGINRYVFDTDAQHWDRFKSQAENKTN